MSSKGDCEQGLRVTWPIKKGLEAPFVTCTNDCPYGFLDTMLLRRIPRCLDSADGLSYKEAGGRPRVCLITVFVDGHIATDTTINVDKAHSTEGARVGIHTRKFLANPPSHAIRCGVGCHNTAAIDLHTGYRILA